MTSPSRTLTTDGVKRKLTDDEFHDYQLLSGSWIVEATKKEMQSPDWGKMSDEDKRLVVNDIKREARAAAREYLFEQASETDEPEGDDDGENAD